MWGGRLSPRYGEATRPLHFGAEGEARSDLCGAAACRRDMAKRPGRSTSERRAALANVEVGMSKASRQDCPSRLRDAGRSSVIPMASTGCVIRCAQRPGTETSQGDSRSLDPGSDE